MMYTPFEQIIRHRCVLASRIALSRTASRTYVPRRALASRIAPSRTASRPRAPHRTCVQHNVTSRFADISSSQLICCGVLAIFH